ncbi:hypothetical protein BD324DRAFT_612243 [Kockovaella imperatae]|uniref:Uncharacterized protein n=1 Tax=Kockovaella imperatae TaxID=4999 RepID=A0A1Y1UTT8_9TREE|nr:hypothetical protein BD324DRAFT_612243 [Kockovaella imperatae]ORX40836.1 hypothetical protein BD324DRAFT_612243 [Kockovaella imperatae]
MSSSSTRSPSYSSSADKVWPPRQSDHSNSRLAFNMITSTMFGLGVKATQVAILMETKLYHYTPEMKAITKIKWLVPSVYLKTAAVWAPVGYIYYWSRLRISYLLAQKQREMAQSANRTLRSQRRAADIEIDGLPM